jgi:hypothetical protein
VIHHLHLELGAGGSAARPARSPQQRRNEALVAEVLEAGEYIIT